MSNTINRPKWWKPPIKKEGVTCLCCDTTTVILNLKTKLYNGSVGGWTIVKNKKEFFIDRRDIDFDKYRDLKYIEKLIGKDEGSEYIAEFYSPLRGATYQRH